MNIHPYTYARISLPTLVSNYKKIREVAGTEVLCIVKADGYGHGAVRCACALSDAGAKFFGVANAQEALELRRGLAHRKADILILGRTSPSDVGLLIENGITQTVFSEEYACLIAQQVPEGDVLKVHIKIDSGMNRLGFSAHPSKAEQTAQSILRTCSMKGLSCQGIFTHFACADEEDDRMTEGQWRSFTNILKLLHEQGVSFPIIHACNSAGIYRQPQAHANMVRAGIVLYGIPPSDSVKAEGLHQVMSLHSRITHVHTATKGETVGYGATYRVEQEEIKIATLPIGYADGLIRAYGGCGVRICGEDRPLIGRICMDQCMADVSGMEIHPDEEAVFFDDARPVSEFAKTAGMIPYETVCLIGKRVPRIYEEIKE